VNGVLLDGGRFRGSEEDYGPEFIGLGRCLNQSIEPETFGQVALCCDRWNHFVGGFLNYFPPGLLFSKP
jgi:hypothetical protein